MNATDTVDPVTTDLIRDIYGAVPPELAEGLDRLLSAAPQSASSPADLWDETDVVLITYADQIRSPTASPLQTLRQFLSRHGLHNQLACVHLLPFCPFTSDDGFSVVDYLAVDPHSGDWDDIRGLGEDFDLMFDLVLNHSSKQHQWFQRFIAGDPEFEDFYVTADPAADLSAVIRPRSLPLLTSFDSPGGTRHVWTTFSDDQVDLNYANPRVMLAMIETLIQYARDGARIIRLDAIAFLWKQIGTSCVHLPQTHAAVRLMRHVMDRVAPGTLILTETNVPHRENISYFGHGDDEAHMVYQFSLPPLLLDAVHSGDTSIIQSWLQSLETPSPQTTFFNFTASHDGVGVRPLEGLVPDQRLGQLVDTVRRHGGRVNMRAHADGSESPYELNITYLDAVADRNEVSAPEHSRRFLATQAIMLAMQGVPAVYFHSLVGTPNDQPGVVASGQNRRINRHKYEARELESALAQSDSLQRRVFKGYGRLLEIRRGQSAFHPAATQDVIDLGGDGLLCLRRTAADGSAITVVANLTDQPRRVPPEPLGLASDLESADGFDLLAQESINNDQPLSLRPFQVRWITLGDRRSSAWSESSTEAGSLNASDPHSDWQARRRAIF